jgi:hypothetical protein
MGEVMGVMDDAMMGVMGAMGVMVGMIGMVGVMVGMVGVMGVMMGIVSVMGVMMGVMGVMTGMVGMVGVTGVMVGMVGVMGVMVGMVGVTGVMVGMVAVSMTASETTMIVVTNEGMAIMATVVAITVAMGPKYVRVIGGGHRLRMLTSMDENRHHQRLITTTRTLVIITMTKGQTVVATLSAKITRRTAVAMAIVALTTSGMPAMTTGCVMNTGATMSTNRQSRASGLRLLLEG